ncbi:SRPBCC family protein [Maribacter halichondriae]|uniref:SRPBCC family protein n=1 Tax=Maribacter halichondriae TaxID=2980554 RepID=UPI002359C3A7|nr:SRPBCC family protein [Maribacter sp. Hal144]
MKILKKLLLALAIIIAVPLILALFTKKEYTIVEEITIDRPKNEVFEYVKYLKNQDEYSKWASMDPDMEKSFRGTDATVGFVSAWKSDNPDVGSGEQEILKIDEGKRIDMELRFFEPFESSDLAYVSTESISENQTKVKWGFDGKMKYPMNLMLLFMDFEGMIGDDLQTGLKNLKDKLEN